MTIESTIREATCRVDKGGDQLGSAFWVTDNQLITAAHVVEHYAGDGVSIQTVNDESVSCKVVHYDTNTEADPGTDLALLQSEVEPDDHETLSITQEVPSLGAEVVWSGYARLFGEPKIDRQRFGWGRVASAEYGESTAEFFEVDGLFNPSHSGGPVVSKESKDVVGVVAASAGAFDNLEEAWGTRSHLLNEAFSLYDRATGDSGFFSTFETSDPRQGAQIQHIFDQIGVDYEAGTDDGNITVKFRPEEIPARSGVVLGQMSELLLDTARSTFQMGVGIATGGESLDDLV
ncbi:S1 family peptidase [Halococcus sp. AFM35]|uniref:S1 family peptidase n=1 Tax=Halococcus sp. AFM35 TaxID=3421653 RepID=UPI003EBE001F